MIHDIQTSEVDIRELDIIRLSEKLLVRVKRKNPTWTITDRLEACQWADLIGALSTDTQKKTFWINVYNAYFLMLRRDFGVGKPAIYREKLIEIAGRKFSLDDIEHGILRKYRWRRFQGYFPNIFAPMPIRNLALKKRDFRIHFALNCGARSCPTILIYREPEVDKQLESATRTFLEAETEIDSGKREIRVTRLFRWYKGDFGGHTGIRQILKKYLDLDAGDYSITFSTYNWEEALDNFQEP